MTNRILWLGIQHALSLKPKNQTVEVGTKKTAEIIENMHFCPNIS